MFILTFPSHLTELKLLEFLKNSLWYLCLPSEVCAGWMYLFI